MENTEVIDIEDVKVIKKDEKIQLKDLSGICRLGVTGGFIYFALMTASIILIIVSLL